MIETVIFDYKSIRKILINILCDIIIAKKKKKGIMDLYYCFYNNNIIPVLKGKKALSIQ